MSNSIFPPCYSYTPFHGAAIVVLNQEMAALVADCLEASSIYGDEPVLASVCANLRGQEPIPCEGHEYSHSRLENRLVFTLKRPLGQLIAEAIYRSGEGQIARPLWALYSELRNFNQVVRKAA